MVNTTNAHYRRLIEYPWNSTSFVIKVNSGSDRRFTIPTTGGGYNYDLKTSDGQSFTGLTGNKLINFPSANTDYILEISGDFPHWYQGYNPEVLKVIDIMQWGTIKWSSFYSSFRDSSNLTSSATDKPDLSNVTDMSYMFIYTSFNSDISNWDVSNVVHMNGTFMSTPFNQDISSWNVSNVTIMQTMFNGTPFNQDISSWDVSNVTSMSWMFQNSQFNQDISSWDVSNATHMNGMFQNSQFNQNISGWNVNNVFQWSSFRTGSPLTDPNTPPKFR